MCILPAIQSKVVSIMKAINHINLWYKICSVLLIVDAILVTPLPICPGCKCHQLQAKTYPIQFQS